MRALILSCNTGGGHNAAGRAMAECFIRHGDEALFPDFLGLKNETVSRVVGDAYIDMARRTPRLFGGAYRLGMAVSRHFSRSPVYQANHYMAKYLAEYLRENPVDVIVMPHLYPAETVTYMKRRGEALPPTYAVATDYTCVPFWEETDCDYYVIPHAELASEFIDRGVPPEKLLPYGIPTSDAYRQGQTRDAARAALGLPAEGDCLLVMGGSMGAGSLLQLTKCLLADAPGAHIVVIAGSNRKTAERLQALAGQDARLTVLPFTKQVPLYFRACDALFTKPGGLTSTEAAVSGIPIIHTAPIPGCETQNRAFFTKHGLSVSASTVQGQAAAGLALLALPDARAEMAKKQREYIHADAAERIYQHIRARVEGR